MACAAPQWDLLRRQARPCGAQPLDNSLWRCSRRHCAGGRRRQVGKSAVNSQHTKRKRRRAPVAAAGAHPMLKRKSTRIELKPEDREEYFAHKQQSAKQPEKPADPNQQKIHEKNVRIGLAKAR